MKRRIHFAIFITITTTAAAITACGEHDSSLDTFDDYLSEEETIVEPQPEFPNTWVNCGHLGSRCNFNGARGVVTVRFTVDGKSVYEVFEGISGVDCDWGTFPSPTGSYRVRDLALGGECAYSTYDFFGVGRISNWAYCSREGRDCPVYDRDLYWIRYGTDGRFKYRIARKNEVIKCTNSRMSIDPYRGRDKDCWKAGAPIRTLGYKPRDFDELDRPRQRETFRRCANEGSRCNTNSNRPFIVSYGSANRYVTGVFSGRETFNCNNDTFNLDPRRGHDKSCFIAPLSLHPNRVGSSPALGGEWVSVGDNGGSFDRTISRTWRVGTWNTDTNTNSQEWSQSISTGFSQEGGFLGTGATVSVEVTSAYARSSSFTNSVSRRYESTVNHSCNAREDQGFVKMWRFRMTSTMDNCLSTGRCEAGINTESVYCTSEDVRPKCLPGDCNNDNCQTCKSDN